MLWTAADPSAFIWGHCEKVLSLTRAEFAPPYWIVTIFPALRLPPTERHRRWVRSSGRQSEVEEVHKHSAIHMNYIVMIVSGPPKGSTNCAVTLHGMNLVAQERSGLLSPVENARHLWFDGPGWGPINPYLPKPSYRAQGKIHMSQQRNGRMSYPGALCLLNSPWSTYFQIWSDQVIH